MPSTQSMTGLSSAACCGVQPSQTATNTYSPPVLCEVCTLAAAHSHEPPKQQQTAAVRPAQEQVGQTQLFPFDMQVVHSTRVHGLWSDVTALHPHTVAAGAEVQPPHDTADLAKCGLPLWSLLGTLADNGVHYGMKPATCSAIRTMAWDLQLAVQCSAAQPVLRLPWPHCCTAIETGWMASMCTPKQGPLSMHFAEGLSHFGIILFFQVFCTAWHALHECTPGCCCRLQDACQ
jgi:hypothetical protein